MLTCRFLLQQREVKNRWSVIAEGHGLVLIKLRLDWEAMWKP